jgi:adenosylcobinamide-phosphate synthase
MLLLSIVIAFTVDRFFSEPRKYHPLVYFGEWADYLERQFNQNQVSKINGIVAVTCAISPIFLLAIFVDHISRGHEVIHIIVSGIVLYVAIGWQSLLMHAKKIITPLMNKDLRTAREALSMIVSRDTKELNERNIAKAATESVLENGADAIFSALFWFCIFGIPGVVVYRLSNTLDAMWGYKNERFIKFGWCAARLDDVLNFIPARLTAFTYAVLGKFSLSIMCWRKQAFSWKSPNAGPVMAAGAGALNVSLGGWATYHGEQQHRALLGPVETDQTSADANSIVQACSLVNRSVVLWLLAIALLAIFYE